MCAITTVGLANIKPYKNDFCLGLQPDLEAEPHAFAHLVVQASGPHEVGGDAVLQLNHADHDGLCAYN